MSPMPNSMQNFEKQIVSKLSDYFDMNIDYIFNWKIHPPSNSRFERWHTDGSTVDLNLTINLMDDGQLTRVRCGTEEMLYPAGTVSSGDAVFFSGRTIHSEPLMPNGRFALLVRLRRQNSYKYMGCSEFLSLLGKRLYPEASSMVPFTPH